METTNSNGKCLEKWKITLLPFASWERKTHLNVRLILSASSFFSWNILDCYKETYGLISSTYPYIFHSLLVCLMNFVILPELHTLGPFSFVNSTIIKFATIYWIATTLSTFIRKTAIISLPQISRFFRHVLRMRTWLIMPIPVECHVTDNFAMFLATEFTLQNSRVVYSWK